MVLESYKRMGVDVMTPGERELELGPAGLKAAFEAAKISAVAANLVDSAGGHPLPADKLIEVAGLSIGVFGILEVLPGQLAELQRLGFRTDDPAEAARAILLQAEDSEAYYRNIRIRPLTDADK